MRKVSALALIMLGLAGTNASAGVIRDSISDNLWTVAARPIEAFVSANFSAYPAVTFVGDGRKLEQLEFLASFMDPLDVPNPSLAGNSIDISIGIFSSLSDWLSDPTRQTALFDLPSNADWRNTVTTIAGNDYKLLSVDLSELNLVTIAGQLQLVSVSIIGAQEDPNFPGISGFLQGTNSAGISDYFAGRGLFDYTGNLQGWTTGVLDPAPEAVAARVTTAIPEPHVMLPAASAFVLLVLRRRVN